MRAVTPRKLPVAARDAHAPSEGLFVGIGLDSHKAGVREACERLMARRIVNSTTHEAVVRIVSPVIVREQIDWTVERIAPVLKELTKARAAAL